MIVEREQQIYTIYSEAVDLPPEQRLAYVSQACADDSELRQEVEALVAQKERFEAAEVATKNAQGNGWGGDIFHDAARLFATFSESYQLAKGTKIARTYEIDGFIGEGGMGTVYQAHHLRTTSLVALKTLSPDLHNDGKDKKAIARFKREAEMIARLHNPHIVQVHDVNKTKIQGKPVFYIVMEWIAGVTLADILQASGPLPLDRVTNILQQVVDALAAVHQCGLTHCDLKPTNIMLQAENGCAEHVKVVDFGLARDVTVETSSQFKTPAYASPEQLSGGKVDSRSDIFSLGVVLYEMLAGERPFPVPALRPGNTPLPLLQPRRPEISVAIESLIESMLSPNPEERPQPVSTIPHLFEQAMKTEAMLSTPSDASTPLASDSPQQQNAVSATTRIAQPTRNKLFRAKSYTYIALSMVVLIGILFMNKQSLHSSMSITEPQIQTRDVSSTGSGQPCKDPPQQPRFNVYPLTFKNTNNNCEDFPLIRMRKVMDDVYPQNEAEMNEGVRGQVGDVFYVSMYVHNGATDTLPPAQTTAQNTKLTTTVSTETGTTHTIKALVTADNAMDAVDQYYKITTGPNDHLEVVPNSGERFDHLGNLNEAGFALGNNTVSLGAFQACFGYSRFYRFQVRIVSNTQTPILQGQLALIKEVRNTTTKGTFAHSVTAYEGDVLEYRILAQSTAPQIINIVVKDVFPRSLRFVRGSLLLNQQHIAEGNLASEGLHFPLTNQEQGDIRYQATVGITNGKIVTTATAKSKSLGSVADTTTIIVNRPQP